MIAEFYSNVETYANAVTIAGFQHLNVHAQSSLPAVRILPKMDVD